MGMGNPVTGNTPVTTATFTKAYKIKLKCHYVPDLDDLEEKLDEIIIPNDMIITLGAGSIWRYSESYMDHLAYLADGVTG